MAAIHDRAVRLNLSFRHVDHRDMGKKKWHLLCDRILLGGESGHQEEESQRKENDPAHKILRGCLAEKIRVTTSRRSIPKNAWTTRMRSRQPTGEHTRRQTACSDAGHRALHVF